jgi:hypothetical protein
MEVVVVPRSDLDYLDSPYVAPGKPERGKQVVLFKRHNVALAQMEITRFSGEISQSRLDDADCYPG